MSEKLRYVALLRGINVGGHHKVSMVDLARELKKIGLTGIKTILNSGNVIFESGSEQAASLEEKVSDHLEGVFGFTVPVLLRSSGEIRDLVASDPFRNIRLSDNLRLYVSFLRQKPVKDLQVPWTSEDGSFRIIGIQESSVCSVLDVSASGTPKGMEVLEQIFGREITTRNWNTILKIAALI